MIKTLFIIIKMLFAILPFVALCIVSKKVNLSKPDRSKQFLMPVITLIYVIVGMFLLNSINVWLLKLINKIPEWISGLGSFKFMPGFLSTVFRKIGSFLTALLKKLNLKFWIFFISNSVIVIVYMIIKKIILKIMSKAVKTDGKLHSRISGIFYEFFPDKNKWCIKENFVQVRSIYKVFYYSSVVLLSLLMMISRRFYAAGLIKTVFYPVFGILIIGELYFYLDGATRREYSNDILGEDEDAYKVVNYSLLRKFLRSVFGDKLLSENTSINNPLEYNITTDEIIKELQNSEDSKTVSFATYINALNKTDFVVDHNYLHSSLDMLNGKSILFNNPFYNDLIPYAFYPMNRTLLSHQKVLIILGRHSIEDDIHNWVEQGIEAVTNLPFLWNIGVLNNEKQDLDIGIVTRSNVLDIELHNANSEFLEKVGFIVIIEPSKLISTAQIGLNLLVKKCNVNENKNIVYCMCDKNCDGLVDALSHALMTNLTEVSATQKHMGTSSHMCWETDGEYLHHRLLPNVSRYLGLGTELSFAALKNQVSLTKWYGGEAFPVTDIHWIDRQYYYELTKYANLPTVQDAMNDYFHTSANLWSAVQEKNCYMTVEDESNNMFEILRDFSTRTTEQGFINIISSNYLLKDYMADNDSIFEADAKAIPFVSADYTRSNRNTILRLILMISIYPVNAETLDKELSLLGINVFDLKKQLWYELYNCYSPLSELPEDYNGAVEAVYDRTLTINGSGFTHDVIEEKDTYNIDLGQIETVYSVSDPEFLKKCVYELRSASYVAEDERGRKNYLGAELSGHIYQKYLPGQFFTFGGKYYEMQYLTADGQVLLRRAADHINGRPTYRQIRDYTIHNIKDSEKIGSQQNISGLKIVKQFADISVATPGYCRMEKDNDFKTAKRIDFEGEKSAIPKRVYNNKEILCVELPDGGEKSTDKVRYTITVMLNEIFKTIFAENQAFVCAVTDCSFMEGSEGVNPLTYSINADGCELKSNAIYIIEDSQLDLGLTVAVERNLRRILSIIHDYLLWHTETLESSLNPPPEPESNVTFSPDAPESEKKKDKGIKGFFRAIGRGIKKFFGKIAGLFKKKPKKGEEPAGDDVPVDGTPTPDGQTETGTPETNTGEEKKKKKGIFGWGKRKKKQVDVEIELPEEEQPVTDEEQPVTDEEQPVTDEEQPVADEEQPVTDEEQPVVDEEQPIVDQVPAEEIPDAEEQPIISEEPIVSDEPDQNVSEEVTEVSDGASEETFIEEEPETANMPAENEISDPLASNQAAGPGFSTTRLPYYERYYMLYGGESEPEHIDINGTLDFLTGLGLERNSLKQARDGKKIAEYMEQTYKPGKPDVKYCDFCGSEIYGVEYETLADGRDRCIRCGRTAIKTGEEFRKIFEDVKRNMESFFNIRINAGIKVEMVNSKTLHKRLGKAFIPTPKSDGRVLGVAISDKNGYTLLVENGSPRMASMLTMAHELTHIWQYINWKDKAIRKKYGKKMRLEIYEGMAKWTEIQYAYLINEPATAKREEIITAYRDDEYGHGFLRYRENYSFSRGTVITKPTPFMNIDTPLDMEYCGAITVNMPTLGINAGDIDEVNKKNGGGNTPTGNVPENNDVPANPLKGPRERNAKNVSMYAYNLLNDDEKKVYDAVLEAVKGFAPSIESFEVSVDHAGIEKIIEYMQRDNPGIFWFQNGAKMFFDSETKIVSRVEFTYCLTQEEAQTRQEEIDASIKEFLDSVSDRMSDYELTLRVYENIIKLVDYDTLAIEAESTDSLSPDVPDDIRSIYGVFVNKKAVCAGYARAMQYLLNIFGIECAYLTNKKHAWNLIKLENDYYFMDVTWGDSSDTKEEKNNPDEINYDCFCITTEELKRIGSHEPDPVLPVPDCTATKCNYHRRHGLYFEAYDFNKTRNVVCEFAKQNKFDISFKFASVEAVAEAKKQLIDNDMFRKIIQYANLKAGTKISPNFKYSYREERLIIAFYMK